MVKKIRTASPKQNSGTFIKTLLTRTTPRLAVLIKSHHRPKMLKLMFKWYQEIKNLLTHQLDIQIYLHCVEDEELLSLCQSFDVKLLSYQSTIEEGRALNHSIQALASEDIDAVVYIAAGDLLSQGVFQSYADKLKAGALFIGSMDQFFFDPAESKFMYWSRESQNGLDKTGETAWLLSRALLEEFDWKLWLNQNEDVAGYLHKSFLKKIEGILGRVQSGSCVLMPQKQLNGLVISLKSELGRALYEKTKWQNLKGISFADFENTAESHISAEWIDRLYDFDERLILDILIEDEAGYALWQQHYNDSVYKFLPYAKVRLRLLSQKPISVSGNWSNWVFDHQSNLWNEALVKVSQTESEAVLIAGRGGLVDLKTMEYYIIRMVQKRAKLMGLLNFYLISPEGQAYFWKGDTQVTFKKIFGFGLMIGRDYLEQLNWQIWNEQGDLLTESSQKLDLIFAQNKDPEKHVIYPCISHQLAPIAILGEKGVFGFEGSFLRSELIPIDLTAKLPANCFSLLFEARLKKWASYINSRSNITKKTDENVSQVSQLSPLERAKALLAKNQSVHQEEVQTMTTQTNDKELSPLEKAKALLAKAKSSTESTPAPAPAPIQPQATELSPLEKAKALLAKAKSSTESAPAPAPVAPIQTQSTELSPLEKAKALLAKAKSAPAPAPVEPTPSQAPALTQDQSAQLAQMQQVFENQMNEALTLLNGLEQKLKSVNPQAKFLCEQGEKAFTEQNFVVAKSFFESALLIAPDYVDVLNNMAVLSQVQGDHWKALSFLLMALQIDDQHQASSENLLDLLALEELSVAKKIILG